MIDLAYQVTALASVIAFSAVGVVLRRLMNRGDRE